MRALEAIPSPAQRRWIITLCLVPFALLCIWSAVLIPSTRAVHHEMDHCTAWNQEIGRHRDVFESLHARASSLLTAPNVGIEAAGLDAAFAAFERSRETLGQKTHGEPDPSLAAVDQAVREYGRQMNLAREEALDWFRASPGIQNDAALSAAREAFAHLDHRRLDVLGAFQALERRHRARLEGAIQANQRNTARLSWFAAVALLISLGFGAAATSALWLKHKSESASHFAQTLVDTLPEGLLAWGRNGIVLRANAALARMTGHSAQVLVPGILVDRILPLDVRRQLEKADPGGRISFNLSHAAGRMLAVEASMGILHASEGSIHIAVFRDISRSTEAERRLLENRRMAELGENMAGFSRDLQRVFHPVLLSMEMLKRPEGGGDSGNPTWAQLERSVQATAELLGQIVKFANQDLHPERTSTFDMNACVQEVVESFQDQGTPMGRLDLDLASIPAMVGGPRERFKASLELLIQRALDATGGGPAVKIRTWDEDGFNCLEILDSGDCIPASQIQHVFEPVYLSTPNPSESAFALFNVASTIQGMGGQIQAERRDGGWTRFLISIPQGW
ncbi:MAG: PAS domain S-box protein [Acidobacteria bacterium]|nr:PAS domain S-box protein [Acidobacteriota bacterium]